MSNPDDSSNLVQELERVYHKLSRAIDPRPRCLVTECYNEARYALPGHEVTFCAIHTMGHPQYVRVER